MVTTHQIGSINEPPRQSLHSVLTDEGDMLVLLGGTLVPLHIGDQDFVLTSDGGRPAWKESTVFTDPTVDEGDMLMRQGGVLTRLATAPDGYYLSCVSGYSTWGGPFADDVEDVVLQMLDDGDFDPWFDSMLADGALHTRYNGRTIFDQLAYFNAAGYLEGWANVSLSDLNNVSGLNVSLPGKLSNIDGQISGINGTMSSFSGQLASKQNVISVTASRALVSNAFSSIVASTITDVELGRLSGVSDNIQTQLQFIYDEVIAYASLAQPTITGAGTTITTYDLTPNRILVSDGSGKIAVSNADAATVWIPLRMTADESRTSDAVYSEVSGLAAGLDTGIYELYAFLRFSGPASGGYKCQFRCHGGATLLKGHGSHEATAMVVDAGTSAELVNSGAATTEDIVTYSTVVRVASDASAVRLEFAQAVANGTPSTCLADSFICYRKIG